MAKTIHKYHLDIHNSQTIMMPEGAHIIHVNSQDNYITMWEEVDPDAIKTPRTFWVMGTGQDMPQNGMKYIGTCHVKICQSNYVWHIYEKIKKFRNSTL